MLTFCITGLWDATFLHHRTMGCYLSASPDYGMLPFCITGLWDATFLHHRTMRCYLSASTDYGMLPFCISRLWDATFLHHQTMGCYFSALPDYGMLPDSNGDHTRQGLKQKKKKKYNHKIHICDTDGCSMLLYIHRAHKDYSGQGTQDVHLHFHTAPEFSTESCTHHSPVFLNRELHSPLTCLL